jgi:hypothetical protein
VLLSPTTTNPVSIRPGTKQIGSPVGVTAVTVADKQSDPFPAGTKRHADAHGGFPLPAMIARSPPTIYTTV